MRMSSAVYPPLVIAGCSGAGKGTLIGKLMEWEPTAFGFSVSHTTRDPRPGETDGVHYHFTKIETMKAEIESGCFVESAHVHGNYYGTSKAAVEAVQKQGRICILDIDVQGVRQVKASPALKPYYLWVEAPTLDILEQRLRGRGTETEDKIQKRLRNAKTELAFAHPADGSAPFDHYVVNDKLERAVEELQGVLQVWYPHLQPGGGAESDDTKRGGPCAALTNLVTRNNPCLAVLPGGGTK